jgi:hypothetical protein
VFWGCLMSNELFGETFAELFGDIEKPTRRRGKAAKTLELETAIHDIVEERHPITVRGVCYALFVRQLIGSMARTNTNKISRILTRMREEGDIDWRKIVDDSRRVQHCLGWDDPDEAITDTIENYRRDYWQDQPTIVEVWAEKATVQGVLGPVIREYGLPFRVMKGYGSFTAVKEAAEASRRAQAKGKGFIALYLGDWDPSGLHMSLVDLPKRFYGYGGSGDIRRIAITEQDHDCPSFSVHDKTGDTRYDWYLRRHGEQCWELDAINPNDLRSRVEEQIVACLDLPLWERAVAVEQAEINSMQEFFREWQRIQSA